MSFQFPNGEVIRNGIDSFTGGPLPSQNGYGNAGDSSLLMQTMPRQPGADAHIGGAQAPFAPSAARGMTNNSLPYGLPSLTASNNGLLPPMSQYGGSMSSSFASAPSAQTNAMHPQQQHIGQYNAMQGQVGGAGPMHPQQQPLGKKGLSTGALVCIGALICLAVAGIALLCFLLRKRGANGKRKGQRVISGDDGAEGEADLEEEMDEEEEFGMRVDRRASRRTPVGARPASTGGAMQRPGTRGRNERPPAGGRRMTPAELHRSRILKGIHGDSEFRRETMDDRLMQEGEYDVDPRYSGRDRTEGHRDGYPAQPSGAGQPPQPTKPASTAVPMEDGSFRVDGPIPMPSATDPIYEGPGAVVPASGGASAIGDATMPPHVPEGPQPAAVGNSHGPAPIEGAAGLGASPIGPASTTDDPMFRPVLEP